MFKSSHFHIFSHLLIFTSSHIFSSSHLLTSSRFFSSSHLLTLAHPYNFSSSHLLLLHLLISHLLIFTSSHLHIFSHLLLFTSSHSHLFSLALLPSSLSSLLPSCPLALLPLALLPSCPLLSPSFFYFPLKARGSANKPPRNATFRTKRGSIIKNCGKIATFECRSQLFRTKSSSIGRN